MSAPAAVKETLIYRLGRMPCRIYTSVAHDLKVYGVEHVPLSGGMLLASNHQSYLDPVLLGVQLPRPLSFFAKSELFENRYFGWLIRNLNAFPVRLGGGDVGAVKETIRRLQDGHALNLYPEGSRTETGEIGPMLPGIALVVRRAGVPVVPAVIDGSFQAWPKFKTFPRPYPCRVMYGPPMHLADLKAGEIVKRIDVTLRRMFDELRERERREHAAK